MKIKKKNMAHVVKRLSTPAFKYQHYFEIQN